MPKFYSKYDRASNSYNIFEIGRKNEFGEPYCVEVGLSEYEAKQSLKCLENGEESYAWRASAASGEYFPTQKTYHDFYN